VWTVWRKDHASSLKTRAKRALGHESSLPAKA
jgi:hypothetical protein